MTPLISTYPTLPGATIRIRSVIASLCSSPSAEFRRCPGSGEGVTAGR
jgi:hypothetical protein